MVRAYHFNSFAQVTLHSYNSLGLISNYYTQYQQTQKRWGRWTMNRTIQPTVNHHQLINHISRKVQDPHTLAHLYTANLRCLPRNQALSLRVSVYHLISCASVSYNSLSFFPMIIHRATNYWRCNRGGQWISRYNQLWIALNSFLTFHSRSEDFYTIRAQTTRGVVKVRVTSNSIRDVKCWNSIREWQWCVLS